MLFTAHHQAPPGGQLKRPLDPDHLPARDVPASLKELGRCVEKLGMSGLLSYTNLAGKFPDELASRSVFRRGLDDRRRRAAEGGAG